MLHSLNALGGNMSLRLPLIGLLLLSQVSFSQQLGTPKLGSIPDTCPVTRPSDQPFVPPQPFPEKAPEGSFWFGTDELWTSVPTDGTWSGLPHYAPEDPAFRQKLFFDRQGYDWHTEPQPALIVTGKRLDAPARPLSADKANNGCCISHKSFMVTAINLPTGGCWQITGHYHDRELTFVVWVTN